MIVVFGSINVDLVIRVAAQPRPGETVLAPGYRLVPGGKGANQALAARRAGAEVKMYGAVGDDGFATVALGGLRAAGVDLTGIAVVAQPTACAAITVDAAGENQIAVASGANLAARADQVPDAVLGPGTTLVLQLEVALEETARLIARAKARGTRVVLSAAPARALPAALLAGVDLLLVNRIEAVMLAEAACLGGADATGAATALARAFGPTVVVTLGGEGARAVTAAGITRVPSLPITPVDTTGAGDAFAGVLAAALDRGHPLAEALRRASVAGALACLEEGAQTLPDAAAIEAALAALPASR
ncbi:MAG: ribokinase [Alphaproteobacteria bacterium]|nr:ribokinase [Alphaproteobacteria bacterium]